MPLEIYQHQRLIEFLEGEAAKRRLNLGELGTLIGLNGSQLYNIRNGKQPGLTVCLEIARYFDLKPDYVLYLAGHIEEDELNAPEALPVELLPMLNKLEQIKGTPFFDTALDLMDDVLERVLKLFKIAA